MEQGNWNTNIISNEIYNLFYAPFLREEVYKENIVWEVRKKRPIMVYTGKRGMKLLKRSIGGYSLADPNIKKIRRICSNVHH